ncbi:MAG: hypothetical protein CMN75_16675 [Spirochaeta sp.]|nr:hypothetical protein [Spirochaeta sp.]
MNDFEEKIMNKPKRSIRFIVYTSIILLTTGALGPLNASSAMPSLRPAPDACGDYELNDYQQRVYFKDTVESVTPMVDGTFALEYTQQAAYYSIDPGQSPNADALLSKAQKAMRKGTSVYTTASTAAADLHVIRYLSDKKDPQCWPE